MSAHQKPTKDQAEAAVRTLLAWAGEDPTREGLLDTPKRVVEAYGDWYSGYSEDPREFLERTFKEVAGYDEMIVLRDIEFESHCEHHMAPIIGRAHVGYLPDGKVVGISKLARVVETYARRFQVQEKMTAQIARPRRVPALHRVGQRQALSECAHCRLPVQFRARVRAVLPSPARRKPGSGCRSVDAIALQRLCNGAPRLPVAQLARQHAPFGIRAGRLARKSHDLAGIERETPSDHRS